MQNLGVDRFEEFEEFEEFGGFGGFEEIMELEGLWFWLMAKCLKNYSFL